MRSTHQTSSTPEATPADRKLPRLSQQLGSGWCIAACGNETKHTCTCSPTVVWAHMQACLHLHMFAHLQGGALANAFGHEQKKPADEGP